MFEAIGRTPSASFAKEIYLDMRKTVREKLLDTKTCTLKGRTQTAQAMGLYHGIFEPDEEQKAFDVLLDLIHQKNDSFDCGILGCMKIFHVLSKFGYGELAFRMITKKEYPSYGFWVKNGETSLLERWMPDGAPCDSHNHHFFGDIARWFIREIAGLKVENSTRVMISPDLTLPVTSAEAYYELPTGRVAVKWEKANDGSVSLEYSCPDGVECSVMLPDGETGLIKKF